MLESLNLAIANSSNGPDAFVGAVILWSVVIAAVFYHVAKKP